jgi:hypothetical protein
MKVILDNQCYIFPKGHHILSDVQLNELLQIIPELKETEYVKYRLNDSSINKKRVNTNDSPSYPSKRIKKPLINW